MELIEEWFNTYRERLTDYAIAFTKDFDEAEDIVQTVFIKLTRVNLNGIKYPFGYLMKAAKNVFIDIERSSRCRAIPYDIERFTIGNKMYIRAFTWEDGRCLRRWIIKDATLEEDIEEEAQKILIKCFPLFSEHERRAVTLNYLSGIKTTSEVAYIMGVSRSTVLQFLFRARKKIIKALEDDTGVCNG